MRFKSLRQRLIVLLILPVGILMLGTGLLGFVYARQVMLNRWRESAVLSLERAAHSVDMRIDDLVTVVRLLGAASQTASLPFAESQLLDRLRAQPGVTRATLKVTAAAAPAPRTMMRRGGSMMGPGGRGPMGMAWRRARVSQVTSPRYDTKTGQQVVALVFDLKDDQGKTLGRLTVDLRFKYLLQDIVGLRWWQSHDVCLVNHSGRILASRGRMWHGRHQLGGADRPLETALLRAMTRQTSGTLLGAGHPPDLVAGHYRLKRAPWSLILFAPGAKVLAPIVRFRSYFFLAALASVALIILVIRLVTGPMVKSVTEVSEAAGRVARGDYGQPLRTKSLDEIGRLVDSFNTMVQGLRERDFIRDTFGRYVDPQVARELVNIPGATRLGGQKRRVVIMMTDIRGFTPLCEALSPEETIGVVNRYLSGLIEVIGRHQGIILDFLGDSILVLFDPLDGPLAPVARRAVCCALEMQAQASALNTDNAAQGLPEILTGIGLHAGEVVVGNIGSEARTKYGIIGAPVNFTHRVQAEAQGGEIVVSDEVRRELATDLDLGRTFQARLKGVAEPTDLFVVAGLRGCPEPPPQ